MDTSRQAVEVMAKYMTDDRYGEEAETLLALAAERDALAVQVQNMEENLADLFSRMYDRSKLAHDKKQIESALSTLQAAHERTLAELEFCEQRVKMLRDQREAVGEPAPPQAPAETVTVREGDRIEVDGYGRWRLLARGVSPPIAGLSEPAPAEDVAGLIARIDEWTHATQLFRSSPDVEMIMKLLEDCRAALASLTGGEK